MNSREKEYPESLSHPPLPLFPPEMEFPEANRSSDMQQQPTLRAPFVEKEHMFEKVVTPSDVGKLNRLVIPKQHAEKYFPLDSSNDKGMLLNFEDRTGKPWRFRYSYWNSSQSYVMTKGWSRFVKEKRLDAGDTVSFGRGVGEAAKDRLFIDWKRRVDSALDPPRLLRLPISGYHHRDASSLMSFSRSIVPWSNFIAPQPAPGVSSLRMYDYGRQLGFNYNAAVPTTNPYLYMRSPAASSQIGVQLGGGGYGAQIGSEMAFQALPTGEENDNPKRVRLFGVNLNPSSSKASGEEEDEAMESRSLLRVGSSEMEDSPRKGKEPMSLDLEM